MANSATAVLVDQLVGTRAGYRLVTGPTWLMAIPAGVILPQQGWKLHISTRAATLNDLVQVIVPVLAEAGCAFKVAKSRGVLTELNEGLSSPASVGKAVTIYPDPQAVRELGRELAALLEDWPGPRILSDRRVTPSAPVYYRYGPFAAAWEADSNGGLKASVHGPDGEVFEGGATLTYRQPPWVTDPFSETADSGSSPDEPVLGTHYQIAAGLRQAAQGNIYRAIDRRNGQPVIIKQARALVAEDDGGVDARLRLRNERRVLQALDGIAGVPRFVDHFGNGTDEFLVTSDCGPVSLAEEVARRGPYQPTPGPRSLATLAGRLARILAELHERAVIMRDISPKNVVIGEAGPSLIDFGIAAYDGLHLPGGTLGYAPARQWHGEAPAPADDYYALGMVLLFAASGLGPIDVGEDLERARVRALQTISSLYGQHPDGIISSIAGLLSESEPDARAAFDDLRSGRSGRSGLLAAPLPVLGPFTAQDAVDVTGTLLEDLLKGAGDLLSHSPAEQVAPDAAIYRGSAGIGLELLHHPNVPVELISDLADYSATAAELVKLPPGLFGGTTGVSIFLREAAARGITVPAWSRELPETGWQPAGSDLTGGASGVGLGHLWLHQISGDPAHLAVAVRCGQDILAGLGPSTLSVTGTQVPTGVDGSAGRAHALAGTVEFLVALAASTGDPLTRAAAVEQAGELADRTREILPDARSNAAPPIAMSWCQGLTGIGQVLLQAGLALRDPDLASLADQTAQVCISYVPRLSIPARCCGAAGVGNFLIDLAIVRQDDRYWQAAFDVGRQMLLRSGGSPGHPVFARDTALRKATSWAFGNTGLLSFFRRLACHGGPDSLPLPGPGHAAQA